MGHGSRSMINDVYGKYAEDVDKELDCFGKGFLG